MIYQDFQKTHQSSQTIEHQTSQEIHWYKFGYQVQWNFEDTVRFKKENGNTRSQDAVEFEMSQIKEYQVFSDEGKAEWENGKLKNGPSKEYQMVRVHLVFDVKHDGRHKATLVADGYPYQGTPVDTVYSGNVSLRSIRLVSSLTELNQAEIWGADIRNTYVEAKTKEKTLHHHRI